METLIYVLLPLVISGLGFLTYQHPQFARKLIYVLFGLLVTIFIITLSYNTAQIQENINIRHQVESVYILSPKLIKNNEDSSFMLESPLTREHYLAQIIKDNQKELAIVMFQNEREEKLKREICGKIDASTEKIEERNSDLFIYSIIAFISILILFILSYSFDKIQIKKTKR